MNRLVTFGAGAAIVGGLLRIVSAFIPYVPDSSMLEFFYATIDTGFLFGLLAIHLTTYDTTGWLGFSGFAVSLTGVASILGPTSVEYYYLGATIFGLGLAIYAIALFRSGKQQGCAILWLASTAVGGVSMVSDSAILFSIAAVLLATGFISAGITILRTVKYQTT